MKLSVMIGISAVAIAGSSFAQPPSDHASGIRSPVDHSDFFHLEDRPASPAHQAAVRHAISAMHLACAADRQALCSGKAFEGRGDQCLIYYRTKVSASCRQGQDNVVVAQRDN
jgi:hypothetical protein